MIPESPDPHHGRRALTFAAQVTLGVGLMALVFTHYLARVVEKPLPNSLVAGNAGAMDPETTGSIGGNARGVWLNPCSVLSRNTERTP